ncbi:MAG TPA: translation elongation factor 4 [Clostridiaceae bacterium]|nr:translation elongation factor 4 [Clostridia bacterium]CDC05665.1 elongation factor 4 [Clostridium sp. CAG:343]HCF33795.1 elongation factor 4 [Clostridiales bacterium]HJJ18998.1 translation elongation factor 4 [Clostridiaceae bacterium]MBP8634615.1 translation elongation factor 4 [Clostridia bacterium]
MNGNRQDRIRNFSIIAHIDHGKSTLADRLIEMTGVLSKREMESQVLDNMEIEKERGITIKSQAVRMIYKAKDGQEYTFNLIDTPGHVDFNYEVSRSLAACDGAILVVDSSQGVEAQTLANVYLAIDNNLEILPVLNKIDLPNARVDEVKKEIEDIIGIPAEDAPCISAKSGLNVEQVLERIVTDLPAPNGDENAKAKCLIFDSYYDNYKGAVAYVRVVDGKIKVGDEIKLMAANKEFVVAEVGYFLPGNYMPTQEIKAGEVGYIAASIKNLSDIHVGDTITLKENPADEPLKGYKKVTPMVYCGLYPIDGSQYEDLKEALEKLKLNDAALEYEAESSAALGFGFRCGFLGLLHLEIIEERLDREFDLGLITTAPSVIYKVYKTDGTIIELYNPEDLPTSQEISYIEEPFVTANILTPKDYVGNIMELCQRRRGIYIDMKYLDENRVTLIYEMPLNEIIYDFFDNLKSKTKGYASLDYEFKEYKKSNLVKLDIYINGEKVDALSFIVHKDSSYERGKKMVEKLKTVIPRKLFKIPIQAAIGGQVIARETISAMRKDVLAKCYGGDITRKKKLLEKQKRGKKKMREIGNVEIPQEAFLSVLKLDDE